MAAVVPHLEFLFSITMQMGARHKFAPLPNGQRRGFTAAAGGTIQGPRLTGKVLEFSGGDYPTVDLNGNLKLSAHYILETDDGARIYMHNSGYRVASPEVQSRLAANEVVPMEEYYFRTVASFDAPAGPHEWLNQTLIIGSPDRRETYGIFDYYAVR